MAASCLDPDRTDVLQDAKVVDNACLALSRIAEAFAHRPASLSMLCEFGLITNAVQLVSHLSMSLFMVNARPVSSSCVS